MPSKLKFEIIIAKFTETYPDYQYINFTRYDSLNQIIEFICPRHGKQEIRLYAHYHSGVGCKKCSKEKVSKALALTNMEMVNYLWTKDPQASCFNVSLPNPVICPSSASGFDTPQASIPAVPAVLGVAIRPHHKIFSAAFTSLSCSAPH